MSEKQKKETNHLTDEQLWELCLQEEEKKKKIHSYYRDKVVDYDWATLYYETSKDLK